MLNVFKGLNIFMKMLEVLDYDKYIKLKFHCLVSEMCPIELLSLLTCTTVVGKCILLIEYLPKDFLPSLEDKV